jgi:hypothetical protein
MSIEVTGHIMVGPDDESVDEVLLELLRPREGKARVSFIEATRTAYDK